MSQNRPASVLIAAVAVATAACVSLPSRPAAARQSSFAESEGATGNDTKANADLIAINNATSATITGTSSGALEPGSTGYVAAGLTSRDYFRVRTTYTTPGIYRNTLTLNNPTNHIGRLRGFSASDDDTALQTSTFSTSVAQPYGQNVWYSFGGAGKTQEVHYNVEGRTGQTANAYSASFSSSVVTPTTVGTVLTNGQITFQAASNTTSSGSASDVCIYIFDDTYNLYVDSVSGSPTLGLAASNIDRTGIAGFSLTRRFRPGVYYIAIGLDGTATNDAPPSDDATQSQQRLDFDNVIAANNTFYNGNPAGVTRPADFTITDGSGVVRFDSSADGADQIASLYSLNFYRFTVVDPNLPEPGSGALALLPLALAGVGGAARAARRIKRRRTGA